MKKILCLVIAIILMLTFVGCNNNGNETIVDDRFEIVEDGWTNSNRAFIMVDKETKVMYLMFNGGGGITVMLDADGKPLLWEEE